MANFQVGLLGCGRISSVYLHALQKLQQEGVLTVCIAVDKNIAHAEKFASNFSYCKTGTTLQDFINAKPDAAHILTPHFLHAQQTIACLEAGIHVLCEKPISIHLSDADAMIEAAKISGKQLGIIYQNRYIRGVQKAKQLLESNTLGQVKSAWSTLNWWRPPSYYECDWKGSWEREGGGVVIDQAIHSIDLVRYLIGCEAVCVKGNIDRRILTNIEVEDVSNAAITFKNGAVYAFSACNYYTENDPIQIKICAENGTIHLFGNTVTIQQGQENPVVISPRETEEQNGLDYWGLEHQTQIKDFYSCLAQGLPVPFSASDAKKTLELVQGIYYSSYTGKPCAIPADLPPKALHYL